VNISKELLLGLYDPFEKEGFTTFKNDEGENHALQTDVYDAYCKMAKKASIDSIHLNILSSTRNFERQKQIWEYKWSGQKEVAGYAKDAFLLLDDQAKAKAIMRYSAMPGTSRHHWGTDFDINSLEPTYFTTAEGEKIYRWLVKFAGDFGFFQPYTPKNDHRPYGYEEEAWHWSYYPVAGNLLNQYNVLVNYADIQNFAGANLAQELKVIEHFVNGIAKFDNNN